MDPYNQTGQKAGTELNSLLGLNGADTGAAAFDTYKNSTEYQSRLKQGQDSVTAALGGKGLLDSGAAQKSLLNYGQTAASAEFGNYATLLGNQQSTGLSAASALAGIGQSYANAVGTNNTNAANSIGTAALTSANQINGALGNLAGVYGATQGYGSSYGGGHTLGGNPINNGLFSGLSKGNGVSGA